MVLSHDHDEPSFNVAMRLLCDYALIESHEESGGYSMHSRVAGTVNLLNSEQGLSTINLALCCVCFTIPHRQFLNIGHYNGSFLLADRRLGIVKNGSVLGIENYCYNPKALHYLALCTLIKASWKKLKRYLWALAGKKKKTWAPSTY